jgi:hypothetical protein
MELSDDELAGVVDIFGALTRPELEEALSELAFRRGADPPEGAVDDAVERFALLEYEPDDGAPLLVPGPAAFPTEPDGAEDLPHILDVPDRTVDREVAGAAALARLREAAAGDLDDDRRARLLDLTYDLEAWAPVDAADLRERLDDAG